jgi:hypothetical protein
MTAFPHVVGPIARIATRVRWREREWWLDATLLVSSGLYFVWAISAVYLCFAFERSEFVRYRSALIVGGLVGPLATAIAYTLTGGLLRAPTERSRPSVGAIAAVLGAVGGLPHVWLLGVGWLGVGLWSMTDHFDLLESTSLKIVVVAGVVLVTVWLAALTTAWILNLVRAWAWMRTRWSVAVSTLVLSSAVGAAIAQVRFDPFDVW